MPSELERRLRAMFSRPPVQRMAGRAALEDALLHRFATVHPGTGARPSAWRRWLFTGALGAAVAVGACVTPAEYEMRLGNRIAISLDVEEAENLDPEVVARHIRDNFPVDRLEMQIRIEHRAGEDDRGQPHEAAEMRLELTVLGPGVDVEEVWDDLQESFPALRSGRIEDEPLATTVSGTLGGKLSGGAIDRLIDGEGVEAAKARIFADLESRGIDPDQADVQVEDAVGDDGMRRREVRIRVEQEDPPR